jgi:hypothetical protein
MNAKTPWTPSKATKSEMNFPSLSELGVFGVLAFNSFC